MKRNSINFSHLAIVCGDIEWFTFVAVLYVWEFSIVILFPDRNIKSDNKNYRNAIIDNNKNGIWCGGDRIIWLFWNRLVFASIWIRYW